MIYSRFTITAQPSIASQIFLICETKVFDQHEEYLKETTNNSEWQYITVSDSTQQWVTAHHSEWQHTSVSDRTTQWVTAHHSEWQDITVSDRTTQWVTAYHSEGVHWCLCWSQLSWIKYSIKCLCLSDACHWLKLHLFSQQLKSTSHRKKCLRVEIFVKSVLFLTALNFN